MFAISMHIFSNNGELKNLRVDIASLFSRILKKRKGRRDIQTRALEGSPKVPLGLRLRKHAFFFFIFPQYPFFVLSNFFHLILLSSSFTFSMHCRNSRQSDSELERLYRLKSMRDENYMGVMHCVWPK